MSSASAASASGPEPRPPAAPIGHPLAPLKPSSHHPSSTEKFGTPLAPAFSPDVPHASSGASGLFSHTSTPCTR